MDFGIMVILRIYETLLPENLIFDERMALFAGHIGGSGSIAGIRRT